MPNHNLKKNKALVLLRELYLQDEDSCCAITKEQVSAWSKRVPEGYCQHPALLVTVTVTVRYCFRNVGTCPLQQVVTIHHHFAESLGSHQGDCLDSKAITAVWGIESDEPEGKKQSEDVFRSEKLYHPVNQKLDDIGNIHQTKLSRGARYKEALVAQEFSEFQWKAALKKRRQNTMLEMSFMPQTYSLAAHKAATLFFFIWAWTAMIPASTQRSPSSPKVAP
ncbi:hypothetical protein DV515_00011425 [Chloebia gouldiae]|uniref:Uncharacterized protein n=1 Tax=Chloebia gouldiae TaxID=44316 RepID=A0A3L8S631_CHLGU|nr:hypothetical protein DV515_00011425 [Chloebia gouldiae]